MFLLRSLFEIPIVSPSSFSQHFGGLLQEAEETDSIHDVTLQAGDRTFPAHKYILSMRSEFFRKLFMYEGGGGGAEEAEADGEVQVSEDAVGCDLVLLEKIPTDMLEHALSFIYTDSCELLLHGTRPRGSASTPDHNQNQDQVLRCGRKNFDGILLFSKWSHLSNGCYGLNALNVCHIFLSFHQYYSSHVHKLIVKFSMSSAD